MSNQANGHVSRAGMFCPIDLPERALPFIIPLWDEFDSEGFQRGERINGAVQCPQCGLWWPCVEEPEAWEEEGQEDGWGMGTGRWLATEWWGGVVCGDCNLLMVDQLDGTPEVYSLP